MITWLDAECESEWKHVKDLQEVEAPTVITIGVVVAENKRRVTIASTLSEDDVNQTMIVPAGMIMSKRVIGTVEIPSRLCPKKDGEPMPLSPTRKRKKVPPPTTS
jgi:hypothetical protein